MNKNLQALRNDMAIAGLEYLVRHDFNTSIEFYYKRYRDLPTGDIPGQTDYVVLWIFKIFTITELHAGRATISGRIELTILTISDCCRRSALVRSFEAKYQRYPAGFPGAVLDILKFGQHLKAWRLKN